MCGVLVRESGCQRESNSSVKGAQVAEMLDNVQSTKVADETFHDA